MNSPAPAAPVLQTYQQQVLDFLARPYAAVWLGIGYGKTLTTLAALMTYIPKGHILVVAPKNIARSTWVDEIQKWGLPIRVKSLIVDENDRPLSVETRNRAFAEVFTDPPTMYFINQDLLTQSPNMRHVLVPALPSADTGLGPCTWLEDQIRQQAALAPQTREELLAAIRAVHSVEPISGRKLSKTRFDRACRMLLKREVLTNKRQPCQQCLGDGCPLCCNGLVDQMPRQGTKKKPQIVWPFATLIIDESQGFASHDAQRFQALAAVRPAISRVIELTGTPTPNGLHDLWSQMYLLDQGAALGHNITEFRRRYFVEVSAGENAGAKKYELRPGAAQEIYRAISHLVISAFTTKLQLPPLNVQNVPITMPSELLEQYKQFRRELVLDIVKQYTDGGGDIYDDDGQPITEVVSTIVANNRAVLNSKLLQFASGAMHAADPDDPSTAGAVEIIHNEKLHMLEHIVKNTAGPVLIAYYFRPDRDRIVTHLRAAGIKGTTAFDGSRKMLADWNAGRIPALVLHPASAGHGLNFQHGGSTLIWYTLSHSLQQYQQTNGRLYRTGQNQPVNILRLLTSNTLDEKLPQILGEKAQLQDALLLAASTPSTSGAGSTTDDRDEDALLDEALLDQLGEQIQDALGAAQAQPADL